MLPYSTADVAGIPARIKSTPEDFEVHEIPAYSPTGRGEHLFVHFEKVGFNTHEAVTRIARALGVDPREAGVAGMKDRQAVTRQWASFFKGDAAVAGSLQLDGIRILDAVAHEQKLRTGHLAGNRFSLVLRDVDETRKQDIEVLLKRLEQTGVPNYFGEQRFGRDQRNVSDAREWIVNGGRAPREQFRRKLLVSTLQSEIFNEALANRLRDGLFDSAVDGDLLRKEDTGGLFTTDDLSDADGRVKSWEISPTGPIFGASMRWPERVAKEREEHALTACGVTMAHFEAVRRSGEGSRRVYRIRPRELSSEWLGMNSLRLVFTLPKGAYATVLMREFSKDTGVDRSDAAGAESSAVPEGDE